VVLADWDNTLYAGFTAKRWVEFLESRNLFSNGSCMKELFQKFIKRSLGYETFCCEAAHAYGVGIAGRLQSDIAEAARLFVASDRGVFPFVSDLWRLFEAEGLKVIVISGAPSEVLHVHAKAIGFEVGGALQLEIKELRYTGRVLENAGLGESKLAAVQRVITNCTISLGMGDANSDLPLLRDASVACVVLGSQRHSSPFVPGIVPLDPEDPQTGLHQVRLALARSAR
jgi:phosphoserine phosphatase